MFRIKGSDFQWGEYGDALLKIEQSPFVCAYACVCVCVRGVVSVVVVGAVVFDVITWET